MERVNLFFWKKKSQLELWFSNLQISSLDIIRFATFFGIGFLSGLFFKKWSKYIILVTVAVTIVFAILQGFSIITINFITIQNLTGLQNIHNIQTLCIASYDVARKYTFELGCSLTGFIIGFKTG